MDPNSQPSQTSSPAVPVPPLPAQRAFLSDAFRYSTTTTSSSTHSRRSLKSLGRLIADHRDHRDPKKLLGLVNKLHEQLGFEKERADRAEMQSSEAMLYLKSICEEKLRALRDMARLEEELKLYKVQYDEAQKEIFRAQKILHEVDEKRFRAEKQAADARSALRRAKDEISIMKAQEEGRQEGIQEGFRRGREIGIQEGMRMAQDEIVRVVSTPPPPAPVIPQVQQQTHSRAPSIAPSRPPTVPPKSPTPPSISPEADATIQPVLPSLTIPDEPRTSNFQVISPSSHIPPDNFIPLLDEDNRIRLPPAFEFTRSTSPAPPPQDNEEIRTIPSHTPIQVQPARSHHSASVASASPTMSHLSMLGNPHLHDRGTPMSVIPESHSQENSPGAAALQRQPSLAAQSVKSMASGLREPVYTRPRSTSGGSSISGQPPPAIQGFGSHTGGLMEGTSLGITTQTPTMQFNPNLNDHGVSGSMFLPPIADPRSPHEIQHQLDAKSPMMIPPRQFPGGWNQGLENVSSDSMNPPVIPHPDLFTDFGDEDDAVSSGMESMESFTTPPPRQQKLPSRAGSMRSVGGGSALSHRTGPLAASHVGSAAGPSRSRAASVMSASRSALSHHTEPLAASHVGSVAGESRAGSVLGAMAGGSGSAIGTVPDAQWDNLVNNAQGPPPDAVYTPKTRSNKGGSVLSMKTTGSRSGR